MITGRGKRIKFELTRLVPHVWDLAAVWAVIGTIMVGASLTWNIERQKEETYQVALNEARTVFERDVLYYRWAAGHHGVMVPINEATQPNPYLAHVPDYIVSTLSGRSLTLINPEYMIRQVYGMQNKEFGAIGHITSLNPIRPENAPDPWERMALKAFEHGEEEASSIEALNEEPYLRLMRPMVVEEGCLECHAVQGYSIGDIRGGISISIPMGPLLAISSSRIVTFLIAHAAFWMIGLAGIFLGTYWITQSIREREQVEARTRSIIENMLEGLVTIDENGLVESFNPAAAKLFGYSPEEVIGQDVALLVEVPNERRKDTDVASQLRSGRGKAMGDLYELMGRRKDGSLFPIEITLSEMPSGEARLSIAMIRDVTERKNVEEALRESQTHIIKQEKLASLGTMMAGIAHEINNPTQAIGFSMEGLRMNVEYVKTLISALKKYLEAPAPDLIKEREGLGGLLEEVDVDLILEGIDDIALRNIESVGRIDKIIKSTKRMAHVEDNFTACDLNTIVSDAVTLTHNQVKYDMTIQLDLAPKLPTFQGLAQELGQVFINLIINARDAVKEKGLSKKEGRLVISTHYNRAERRLEARFEDNGIGIENEIISKIFDPFFTTKSVGQGIGLGLNLCHVIIEAHGGDIVVKSKRGEGSRFSVRLTA